jgi:D-tyrosyl-tRNA(Tyr) deacylase
MRAVVQRVSEASVRVGDEMVGRIGRGILVLVGVARGDGEREADYLIDKIVHLRIFEDDAGKLNRSVLEVGGEALVVSQFTLLGDCRKGRRPSFIEAAGPEHGNRLYEHVVTGVRRAGVTVQTGRFRALMSVSLVNDGPVTLVIDTPGAGA